MDLIFGAIRFLRIFETSVYTDARFMPLIDPNQGFNSSRA